MRVHHQGSATASKARSKAQAFQAKSPSAASDIIAPESQFFDDQFYNRLWYLEDSTRSQLSIDINSIWTEFRGSGVKVGVIDTQIDFTHRDLSNAYDTQLDYNFAQGTNDPQIDARDLPNSHGTMVAGVISAQAGNGFGTVGIASEASLVGLAIDYSSDKIVEQILQALNGATHLDVVNSSWSFIRNFADNFQRQPAYEEALQNLVENGRNGLGTSVVFAAGNAGISGSSNYHNFQNSPFTIAVGSVDSNGEASSFSSIGANVLISAAGRDVFTTTLNDKFTKASGTSFAAPAVSGAIALLLEANPDLGYRDIQEILAYSARKEGLSDTSGFGDGWQINGAGNHNGGGLHFSDNFGFGFLNVHDAVRLAESWTSQSTYGNLASFSQQTLVNETLVAGRNDSLLINFDIAQSITVEHVQLALNIAWRHSGDLDVHLISPEGTSVRLVYDLPDEELAGRIRYFEFSSVASLGELSQGTWQVLIVNNNPDATDKDGSPASATLKNATLTILGDDQQPQDDVYIYTDEFAAGYRGRDLESRSTLFDGNGGNDTLNAAAITSHSTIDLSGRSATIIAGHHIDLGTSVIENAFGGDGNDRLTGSDGDNVLKGGRGDDAIYFGGGNDSIDGQQGHDTLFVDAAFAAVTGFVTEVGSLALSLTAGAISSIVNVETFSFQDTVYTLEEIVALLDQDGLADTDDQLDDPQDESDSEAEHEPEDIEPVPEVPLEETPEEPAEDPIYEPERSYDTLKSGTDGDDKIRAAAHENTQIDGMDGNDFLRGRNGDDELLGGNGTDRLKGSSGDDYLYGGNGNDKLLGGAGDDRLYGDEGQDFLIGGDGDDMLRGGAGADKLKGGKGADIFIFDLSDLDALDLIKDFNADEGDTILITGVGENSLADFHFVSRGRYTLLELQTDEGAVEIAKIKGAGVETLELQSIGDDFVLA